MAATLNIAAELIDPHGADEIYQRYSFQATFIGRAGKLRSNGSFLQTPAFYMRKVCANVS